MSTTTCLISCSEATSLSEVGLKFLMMARFLACYLALDRAKALVRGPCHFRLSVHSGSCLAVEFAL
jgi:hypothetical protein